MVVAKWAITHALLLRPIAMQMMARNAGTSVAKKRAAVTSAGRRGCAAGATI